jgi:hypothetical protein
MHDSLSARLAGMGITLDYVSAGRVWAGDDAGGPYGSAPLSDVLAALDRAEETPGDLAARFAMFHDSVTFEVECEVR